MTGGGPGLAKLDESRLDKLLALLKVRLHLLDLFLQPFAQNIRRLFDDRVLLPLLLLRRSVFEGAMWSFDNFRLPKVPLLLPLLLLLVQPLELFLALFLLGPKVDHVGGSPVFLALAQLGCDLGQSLVQLDNFTQLRKGVLLEQNVDDLHQLGQLVDIVGH